MKKISLRMKIFLMLVYCTLFTFAMPLLFGAIELFARAGGAGGGGGGGGGGGSRSGGGGSSGGSGGGDAIVYLIFFLIQSGPPGWIALGVIGVGGTAFYFVAKKNQSVIQSVSKPQSQAKPFPQLKRYQKFMESNPEFNETEFLKKVEIAFTEIQYAWAKMDISGVRKFMSDGVYQRFNTQFKMMRLLKQFDQISGVKVLSSAIDKIDMDGDFDILHVEIVGGMYDKFYSEMNPEWNSPGGYESFTEFWSFIRKRGVKNKDMYSSNLCPNCGSPLPEKMGEVSKCEYCGSLVNSGDFDWVLAEITQFDDYKVDNRWFTTPANLNEKVKNLIGENKDFSVQSIEDKASNGYLQILSSITSKEPGMMRRFVSNEAFEKLKAQIPVEQIVYNRLYLNSVTLVGIRQTSDKNILAVAIKCSYQRVQIEEGRKGRTVDPAMTMKIDVVLLSRNRSPKASKGSLYVHMCSNCGAPVKDSLETRCEYCNTDLNSDSNDWIISDLMTLNEYIEYYKEFASEFEYKVDHSLISDLYNVKDFALNNMLIMIAADGVFAEEERVFAEDLARKWGYKVENLVPWFEMAKSGKLSIRMPEDRSKRQKIFNLMKKTAEADQNISDEEQNLLNYIRGTYLPEEGIPSNTTGDNQNV